MRLRRGGKKVNAGRGYLKLIVAIITVIVVWVAPVWAQSPYFIHVGSYKNPANANAAVTRFRSMGYEAFARYESVPGRGWWNRVYIGRFITSQEAARVGRSLESQRLISFFTIVPSGGGAVTALSGYGAGRTGYFDYGSRGQPSYNVTPRSRPVPRRVTALQATPPNQMDPYGGSQMGPPPNQLGPLPGEDPFAGMPPEVVDQLSAPPPGQPPMVCEEEPFYPEEERAEYWEPPSDGMFTLFFKTGVSLLPWAEEFRLTQVVGTTTSTYRLTGPSFYLAVEPSLRVWKMLSVDVGIERELAGGMDAWYFNLGPRVTFELPNNLSPYIKTALVYGVLDWDNPGSFSDSFGWNLGTGLHYKYRHHRFGMELMYRGITFDYEVPSGYTANKSAIDMSGLIFSFSYGYNF